VQAAFLSEAAVRCRRGKPVLKINSYHLFDVDAPDEDVRFDGVHLQRAIDGYVFILYCSLDGRCCLYRAFEPPDGLPFNNEKDPGFNWAASIDDMLIFMLEQYGGRSASAREIRKLANELKAMAAS